VLYVAHMNPKTLVTNPCNRIDCRFCRDPRDFAASNQPANPAGQRQTDRKVWRHVHAGSRTDHETEIRDRPGALSMSAGKRCSRCQQVKPMAEYYRNGKRQRAECKTCNRAMNAPRYQSEIYRAKKWVWYCKHREEHIERSRKNRIERNFPHLRSEEYKPLVRASYEPFF